MDWSKHHKNNKLKKKNNHLVKKYIELFFKIRSEWHVLRYSQFTMWKSEELGEEKSRETNYKACCQLHRSWMGWISWRKKPRPKGLFSISKKKKKKTNPPHAPQKTWLGRKRRNEKSSSNTNKNLNTCTCLLPFLLPCYLFICSFSFKAPSLSQFHEQRQQTAQSFMAISGFWHGLKSRAYEFQCSIKLSEGVLSRAEIISPSVMLCRAYSRYYPWTDKGSILQRRGPGWQRADTAASLCDYPRGAGKVQGADKRRACTSFSGLGSMMWVKRDLPGRVSSPHLIALYVFCFNNVNSFFANQVFISRRQIHFRTVI